ncbi:multiple coagulation factor deficiency protein 2 homolog [Prorops nasuta]|uniref:multiple coagulation factor deficiency protein 2 homolog n=1 Tax=Prorops nasuta TaxID=863751 RepID=UPI0034CEAE80
MNWLIWIVLIGSLACKYSHGQGQRVAPGVPPQHYQQPTPIHQAPPHGHGPQHQQQYQQVPQTQGQIPIQQQVPVQQHHIPVQNQVPNQQQHQAHHHDHPPQQIFNAANIAQEKEHIKEHLEVPMDTSKMTEQELQFHYFKMHDADNNNMLDGSELIKSLIHWHEQGNKDSSTQAAEEKVFKDEELVNLIDPILSMDDTNKDGFIDYPEFIRAQQKAAATGRT